MVSLTELHLRAARARIAAHVVPPAVDPRLGEILLRDDQRAVAGRVAAVLFREGGCLLADDVGRGKTYVALAIARMWSSSLVVAPAALRSTWLEAMRRAGVGCALTSHEALSRGRLPGGRFDGVVVDESHHYRTTTTRRYSALAELSSSAPLLLLSATPLQNRRRDLAAQVALFHGSRAFALDDAALSAFVVRGGPVDDPMMPAVAPPMWIETGADDGAVLEAILALPSPAVPSDGGDAGVLRTINLLRAWASSRAALRASLRQRRRVATAIEQCAFERRVPTKRELVAWLGGPDAIQLGFASMLASETSDSARSRELLGAATREHAALDAIDVLLAGSPDPDDARIAALRRIRADHSGERVLAFAERAETARAFFARLRGDGGVGLLTAADARIASGRIPREMLLAAFAPRARGAAEPPLRERMELLIATDLLSEGVNLQDASIVVHLDLPWNPARLAQRVGRVRRPGGSAIVHAYLVAPPAQASRLLDVEHRLREKLGHVARTIGQGIDVIPRLTRPADDDQPETGLAAVRGEVAQRVACWRRPDSMRVGPAMKPIVAGIECGDVGWLAALHDARLVASFNATTPETGASVSLAVRLAEGPSRVVPVEEAEAATDQCAQWLAREAIAAESGTHVAGPLESALDRRIARMLERAPRHQRAELSRRASRLVTALSAPRSLGAERALQRLLDAREADLETDWLDTALRLADTRTTHRSSSARLPRITAIIVFGPRRERCVSEDEHGPPPMWE
jgi:hypothetical protein